MQHFLLFPNSQIKSDHPPAHSPLRPPPGGRSGSCPPWGHTHARLGRCNWAGRRNEKGQRGGHGPVTGSPPAPQPAGTPTLPAGRLCPAPAQRTPPGTPAAAGKYLRGTAKSAAGFLERTERRWGCGTRPNGATLTPPAPGYCRNRKCCFHFRGAEAGPGGHPARGPGHRGNVVFLGSAASRLRACWPRRLQSEAGEGASVSSPAPDDPGRVRTAQSLLPMWKAQQRRLCAFPPGAH